MLSGADVAKLEADLRNRLADWRGLLQRHPSQARQLVRVLLVGRLVFTPEATPEGDVYRFSGQVSLGRVLAGEILAKLPMKLGTATLGSLGQPVDIARAIQAPARKQYRTESSREVRKRERLLRAAEAWPSARTADAD